MGIKPDQIRVFPEEWVDENLNHQINGLYYWDLQIQNVNNFWSDKPETTNILLGIKEAELLVEQLQVAIELRKIMLNLEEMSLIGDSLNPLYYTLKNEAMQLTHKLRRLNFGTPLDTPKIENRKKVAEFNSAPKAKVIEQEDYDAN